MIRSDCVGKNGKHIVDGQKTLDNRVVGFIVILRIAFPLSASYEQHKSVMDSNQCNWQTTCSAARNEPPAGISASINFDYNQ
jgi:hypothetical protein